MREKSWLKITLALVLMIAVGAALWFTTPVRALNVDISDPSADLISSAIPFDITVSVSENELLPISQVDLSIFYVSNPGSYTATCTDLPLDDGSRTYLDAQTGGGDVAVTANVVASSWGYGYGYGYLQWGSTAYEGGGYGYRTGAATITYNVTWASPSNWPAGSYNIVAEITAATGDVFTERKPVTLRRPGGGGGGGGGADIIPPRISDVTASDFTSTTVDIYWTTHEKADSQVEYWITTHMFSALDEEMVIDHHIRLTGLTPGATYSYITISVDRAGNKTKSEVMTFNTSGSPATFDVRLLEITPSEIEIGDTVNVSLVVYNTGDATGTYTVNLNLDGAAFATKEVTVAGGAGQKVEFTITGEEAKTYSVDLSGLKGTFTVTEVSEPEPPIEPEPEPEPPITPTPEPLINWWLIGGIIAGLIAVAMVVLLTIVRQRTLAD